MSNWCRLISTATVVLLVIGISVSEALAGLNTGHLDTGFDPGAGPDDLVAAIAVQVDGKVLIAGRFDAVDGTTRHGIARLNADGSHDSAGFGTMTGANGAINALAIQSNGRILIGGAFTTFDDTPRNRLARLTTFGELDTSFDPGSGANTTVEAIAVQPDGRIIIGGGFTSYNGTTRNYIARLNVDGSLDTSFDASPNHSVQVITLQPDGKILIGGRFDQVNGVSCDYVARLNTDGSLDTGFNGSANAVVHDIAVQPNEKIVMVGDFTGAVGASLKHIARMNANGTRDASFDPGTGANDNIEAIVIQPDGKIVIGGDFQTFNGNNRNHVLRLNEDGSEDYTFYSSLGADNTILAIAQQADGKLLFGGSFTHYHGVAYNRIVRVHVDGRPDDGLDVGSGPAGGTTPAVYGAVAQEDGKLLLAGDFTTFKGSARSRVTRLHPDGSTDLGFTTSGGGPNGTVLAVARQDDGKILIGGLFTQVDGVSRNYIARLNENGSLDTTFNPGTGLNGRVQAIALQPDGKVLIAGLFTTVNGVSRNRVARLNTGGGLDTSFNPGTGANGDVKAIALLSDDKVLIAGDFTTVNGAGRVRVARLNADGSLDSTFDPGSGPNQVVQSIAAQPDGKVLIGGDFTTVNGTSRSRIARLNTNGEPDSGFDPGTGFNGEIYALYLQEDGNIVAGGDFTLFNGVARFRVARLRANGDLDADFFPGSGPNGAVRAMTLQPGAKIVIAGDFDTFGGVTVNKVTRLNGATHVAFFDAQPLNGKVNQTYSYTFTATGFPVPTFHIVDGALPPGVTLNTESGLLSGTPTTAGNYGFEIWAINGVTTYGDAAGTITIEEADNGFSVYLPLVVQP